MKISGTFEKIRLGAYVDTARRRLLPKPRKENCLQFSFRFALNFSPIRYDSHITATSLVLLFQKINCLNDFTVTDNIGFKCFYGTIEPLEVVIFRNATVKMLITDGDYEIRSRLP